MFITLVDKRYRRFCFLQTFAYYRPTPIVFARLMEEQIVFTILP